MRTHDEILAAHYRDVNYLDGGCWTWQGRTINWGYGFVTQGPKKIPAHRFFYELLLGQEIPDGMVVDHLCSNRLCVNPAHMEVVSNAENVRRGNNKREYTRSNTCKQGHPVEPDKKCRVCATNRQRLHRARKLTGVTS